MQTRSFPSTPDARSPAGAEIRYLAHQPVAHAPGHRCAGGGAGGLTRAFTRGLEGVSRTGLSPGVVGAQDDTPRQ
jgi:hypothetical protein